MKKRDDVLDILKGLGIILVVAGHCQVPFLTRFAFSFHMPLFFFISGYLSTNNTKCIKFKQNVQRLLIPYSISCLVITSVIYLTDLILKTDNTSTILLSSIMGTGTPRLFFGKDVCIGPLWFLLALFWIKIVHNTLCKFNVSAIKQLTFFAFFIPIANTIATYITLPFSVFPAIGGYGFFIVGHIIRELNHSHLKKAFPLCIIIWLYCLFFSNMDVNRCLYDHFYFIDLIGALGATLFFYISTKKLYDPNKKMWQMIRQLGKYSIIAMCVHSVDQVITEHTFHFWDDFNDKGLQPFIFVFRLTIVITFTIILSKINFIRSKLFQIHGQG